MNIGIDKIGFSMPNRYLDIKDLAVARGIDPDKFTKGLLQSEMCVTSKEEDIVTLGARAAEEILTKEDKEKIDMIVLGTETGIDQSKAAAVFIHGLLKINPYARSVEIKEACYGATAALEFARNHILSKPDSYVLVIASDIAKYGIGAGGESTQGAGSVAMLIKKDPRLSILNIDNTYLTQDAMDFFRPNYSPYPFVEGKFSTELYLNCLELTWKRFLKENNKKIQDFSAFCFHIPYPKMALKGFKKILPETMDEKEKENYINNFEKSIFYSKKVGNIYTGSLFLGLLSLLENGNLKAGDNICLYSYGSGAVSEIFSMTLVENYKKVLRKDRINDFNNRTRLNVKEYEKIFFEKIKIDNEGNANINGNGEKFTLKEISSHKRIYNQ